MSAPRASSSIETPAPPRGTCPGCGQEPGGERCTHCGVAARVGPYRVRKVLGQRGAGRTYLADDVDGLVVLKELSFFTAPDAATLAAFHQEARQLQALTHPRIPRYLDLLQLGTGAETRLYLSQEFVEGTSLEEELSKRRVTELEARELARQVLDILHYLQGRSPPVFHGDLKPANLIRRPDGALFLVDFGAGWVRSGADAEPSRHTPPHQPTGELDVSTDFYALGVTLVDALTWEPQWQQRAAMPEGLATHVDVSRSFREFLTRLMASERDMRFTSAAEALRELEAPEQELLAPSPLLRLRPYAVGTGAALLLFGAGFVTGRATQPPPTPRVLNETRPPARPSTPQQKTQRPAPAQEPVTQPQYALTPGTLSVADMTNSVRAPEQLRQEPATDHRPQPCEYAWFGAVSASGTTPRTTVSDAVDRELGTAWRSPVATEAWLQVDLGRLRTLNSLVLAASWKTPDGRQVPGTLETSLDNVRWRPLLSMSMANTYPPMPYRAWFPARPARYVRLRAADWRGGEAAVSTFELYGPDCRLSPPRPQSIRDDEISPLLHRP